ncbi:MAG: SPFH domain-containing protein [Ignavibacteriales bacterium]|nr:SPFH domain-containing protein [Ignavibacteriales bacterium]
MNTVTEFKAKGMNGYSAFVLQVILIALNAYLVYFIAVNEALMYLWLEIPLFVATLLFPAGFFVVQPNEARVLVLFGKYIGTVRESGFWYANPFAIKRHVSLRIRNFNSEKIKVNDLHGNPIEIAAVVVWSVTDSARALFDVEHYENFVAIQSETAIRALASEYPYDAEEETVPSLRGRPQEISERMKHQVQTRLEIAGVEVKDARISHLAYSPEIAQTMLRRQQAQAVIAARKKIVEGAVGMVDQALRTLSEQHIVELDEEKKATMVNNLLVALVSESAAQPVINTGTLYQ